MNGLNTINGGLLLTANATVFSDARYQGGGCLKADGSGGYKWEDQTKGNDMNSNLVVTNGVVQAKGFEVTRSPHIFYQYCMRVIDLRLKDTVDHDRIKLEIRDVAELLPDQHLRDMAILKHGPEIQNVDDYENLTIEVLIEKQWTVKDQ